MLLNHFLFRSQFDRISLLIKVLIKVNVSQLDPGPSSVVLTSEFSRNSLLLTKFTEKRLFSYKYVACIGKGNLKQNVLFDQQSLQYIFQDVGSVALFPFPKSTHQVEFACPIFSIEVNFMPNPYFPTSIKFIFFYLNCCFPYSHYDKATFWMALQIMPANISITDTNSS